MYLGSIMLQFSFLLCNRTHELAKLPVCFIITNLSKDRFGNKISGVSRRVLRASAY